VNAQFRVQPQVIHSASTIEITKTEFQSILQRFYERLIRFQHSPITNQEEIDEIVKCTSVKEIREKVVNPNITDFINFEYIFASNTQSDTLLCKALTIIPDITITMRPIKGFAIVTTPISIRLLKKSKVHKGFDTGFLTLDQESRVVPLHQSDPKVKLYTLIGIWVSGLEMDENPLLVQVNQSEDKVKKLIQQEDHKAKFLNNSKVLAAALRFMLSADIKSRMSPQPFNENPLSFLLVNFSTPLPQFLEVRLKDRDNSWMVTESLHSISKHALKSIRFQLNLDKSQCYKISHALYNYQDYRQQCNSHRDMNKENSYFVYKPKGELTQRLTENKIVSNEHPLDLPFKIPPNAKGSLYETMQLPNNFLSDINRVPFQETTRDSSLNKINVITPKQQNSANSSTASSGVYNSVKNTKHRSRQRLGTYSWGDQFPSYSGNVSLVRTSEYTASASKNSSFLGQIVIEQQRQIQVLQQQLATLVETMKSITKNNGSSSVERMNEMIGESRPTKVDYTNSFKNAARMIANEDINFPLQNNQKKKTEAINNNMKKHKGPIILKKSQVKFTKEQDNSDINPSIRIKVQSGNMHPVKKDLPIRGSTIIKVPAGRLSNIKEMNESVSTITEDEVKYKEVYTKSMNNEWSIDLPRIYYDPTLNSSKLK